MGLLDGRVAMSTFAGGRSLVARAVDEYGTVDAVALLAGRIPLSPLADVSEDEWDGVTTRRRTARRRPESSA